MTKQKEFQTETALNLTVGIWRWSISGVSFPFHFFSLNKIYIFHLTFLFHFLRLKRSIQTGDPRKSPKMWRYRHTNDVSGLSKKSSKKTFFRVVDCKKNKCNFRPLKCGQVLALRSELRKGEKGNSFFTRLFFLARKEVSHAGQILNFSRKAKKQG